MNATATAPTIGTMIRRCEGLMGTRGITQKDEAFIAKMVEALEEGIGLSEPQVDYLKSIHDAHFAG